MNEYLTVFERRMEIWSILLNREIISRSELADVLSVSVMSISRDIDALSRFAPISTNRGRYGGVYIMNGYSMQKSYLSKDEENLLKSLLSTLSGKNEILMKTILLKFSLPNHR